VENGLQKGVRGGAAKQGREGVKAKKEEEGGDPLAGGKRRWEGRRKRGGLPWHWLGRMQARDHAWKAGREEQREEEGETGEVAERIVAMLYMRAVLYTNCAAPRAFTPPSGS